MLELDFDAVLSVLTEQNMLGLFFMFWYMVIFELPRYGFSIFSLVLTLPGRAGNVHQSWKQVPGLSQSAPFVSVVVAGLNESRSLEMCVRSIRAQSFSNLEIIIVSDGSTDRMPVVARDLVRRGLADRAFATNVRCGKSSAVNLALRFARGEIIINVDCDCSYDRFAIEGILEQFADPTIGIVCGDIVPRNCSDSVVTAVQSIEYLACISLGKRVAAMLDQLTCASGAFSAFRRSAITSLGYFDAGGGEDLDLTLRLRANGWRVGFATDAICYTDVPTTALGLIRQRLRWERDATRVRLRKHRRLLNPFSKSFKATEAIHQLDFLLLNVVLTVCFPLYLLFLWSQMGLSACYLIIAAQIGLLGVDACVLLVAILVTKRWNCLKYLIYIPIYNLFSTLTMRVVRTCAYIHEWTLDASRRDFHYAPVRVQRSRHW